MAEPFETLREVGVALDGFRNDVSGQFSTLKWIIGGVTAVAVGAGAFLFNKIDRLEDASARNTAILERIEVQLGSMATDTAAIKENVLSASVEPAPGSFEGWVGMKAPDTFDAIQKLPNYSGNGWIYLPQD